jgi:hypothetical protein
MKTSCYEQLGSDGWFEFVHTPDDMDNYAEDFPFYRKMQAAGIPLYCDLDVNFGHRASATAYLIRQQGKWLTVLADTEPFTAFPTPEAPKDHLRLARAEELIALRRGQTKLTV